MELISNLLIIVNVMICVKKGAGQQIKGIELAARPMG